MFPCHINPEGKDGCSWTRRAVRQRQNKFSKIDKKQQKTREIFYLILWGKYDTVIYVKPLVSKSDVPVRIYAVMPALPGKQGRHIFFIF